MLFNKLATTIALLISLELSTGTASFAIAEEVELPPKSAVQYLPSTGDQKLELPYKTIADKELCLDLYYPKNKTGKLPIVFYTHGGGWATGSKQGICSANFQAVYLQLLDKGFAVAAINYRLCHKDTDVTMRDCVIDAKDAVRYVVKQSEPLGIDPMKCFVHGDSAGGHLAQMLLLSTPESLPGDPTLAKETYRMVAGVTWYGPCDFEKVALFNHDDRENFTDRFGARILKSATDANEKFARYREMSPVNYLSTTSPPLLMIQGDQDTTIPIKHAYYMKEKADAAKAPVEIMIIKNAGHNWRRVDAPIQPTTTEIVKRTVDFLVNHLQGLK